MRYSIGIMIVAFGTAIAPLPAAYAQNDSDQSRPPVAKPATPRQQEQMPSSPDSNQPRDESAQAPPSSGVITPPTTGDEKSVITPPAAGAAKTPIIPPPGNN